MLKENYYGKDPKNVLIIGDLHCPFVVDGYLEFCKKVQDDFDCGTVIFAGTLGIFIIVHSTLSKVQQWVQIMNMTKC